MTLDRRTSRWLSGLCIGVVLVAVGGLGYLLRSQKEAGESVPVSSRTATLRKLKGKAIAAAGQKDFAAAEPAFREAIAADPSDKSLHQGLALVYLAKQKPHEAWKEFAIVAPDAESARRLDPGSRAWFADLEWQFGDRAKAEKICRNSIEEDWIRPRPTGAALISRAHSFCTENETPTPIPDVVQHIQRAVALDPKSVIPHIGLAHLFWEQKKFAESKRELTTAEGLITPGDGPGSAYMSFVYDRMGRKADAEKMVRQAMKDGTDGDPRIATALSRVLVDLGKKKEALDLLVKSEASTPTASASQLMGYARTYAMLEKWDTALARLDLAEARGDGASKADTFTMRKEIEERRKAQANAGGKSLH